MSGPEPPSGWSSDYIEAQRSAIESGQFPRTRGTIPEAAELFEVSDGVKQVRAVVARETAGAVSPRTQVLALYKITQDHHDAIAKTISAARARHGGVLDAQDALRLTASLVEHAAIMSYWLQAAMPFRQIPMDTPTPHELSPPKSRAMRESVLSKIRSTRSVASTLLEDLRGIAHITGREDQVRQIFDNFDIEMMCCEINATVASSGYLPLSQQHLGGLLSQLDAVRLSSRFNDLSDHAKSLIWQSTSVVASAIGNPQMARDALRERRRHANDPDQVMSIVPDQLRYADSTAERLDLVGELRSFAIVESLGAVFTRERLGRLSMLRDALWIAATVGNDASDISLLDSCFTCFEQWLFGRSITDTSSMIRIACDWAGNAVAGWTRDGRPRVERFSVGMDLIEQLIGTTETMSSNQGPLNRTLRFLRDEIGPILQEAIADGSELRVEASGPVGLMPLLATEVGGHAIGSSVRIAYQHPDPSCVGKHDLPSLPDLIVVDRCFGNESVRVEGSAARLQGCHITAFDSGGDEPEIDADGLIAALRRSRSAVIFCHGASDLTAAGRSGLVLSSGVLVTLEELARQDLANLEELVLVACSSGRLNPFVGQATLAHAAAIAGVRQIVFTLWPIRSTTGSRFAQDLLEARNSGNTTAEFFADRYRTNPGSMVPFGIMRP
jgi:hypothetical protein